VIFNGRSLPGHGTASCHESAKRCVFGQGAAADGSGRGSPVASTSVTEGGTSYTVGGRGTMPAVSREMI